MVLASNLENMGIADAAVVALLGYCVVFFGLVLLMVVITIMGKIFMAKDKKAAEANKAAQAIQAGDVVSVDFDTGLIVDETTGKSFQGEPFPPFMQELIAAGGLAAYRCRADK